MMIGDASGFIDPVFSTGVYIAMLSAFRGADALGQCLDHPDSTAATLRQFELDIRKGIARFSWFIYRVTSPAIRHLFMSPRNYFRLVEAILALLAGDIAEKSPIRFRLQLFKALFYVTSFFDRIEAGFAPRPAPAVPVRT